MDDLHECPGRGALLFLDLAWGFLPQSWTIFENSGGVGSRLLGPHSKQLVIFMDHLCRIDGWSDLAFLVLACGPFPLTWIISAKSCGYRTSPFWFLRKEPLLHHGPSPGVSGWALWCSLCFRQVVFFMDHLYEIWGRILLLGVYLRHLDSLMDHLCPIQWCSDSAFRYWLETPYLIYLPSFPSPEVSELVFLVLLRHPAIFKEYLGETLGTLFRFGQLCWSIDLNSVHFQEVSILVTTNQVTVCDDATTEWHCVTIPT